MSDLICLVVDDEPSIRTFLRSILERERFQCLEADHAEQALRLIRKLGGRLDLIISDIKMPGTMNGVDLAHAVRNEFESVPVLLISGFVGDDDIDGNGSFKFVHKPFRPESILEAVREMLMRSDTHRITPTGDGTGLPQTE